MLEFLWHNEQKLIVSLWRCFPMAVKPVRPITSAACLASLPQNEFIVRCIPTWTPQMVNCVFTIPKHIFFFSYSWDLARATRLARLFEQHHPDKKITLIGGRPSFNHLPYALCMPVQFLLSPITLACSSYKQRLGESETRFLSSFCQPHLLADARLCEFSCMQEMPIKQNITYYFAAEEHNDETCHCLKSCFHNWAAGWEKPA